MVPNAITLLALCFGLTGVSLAIGAEWERALAAVVFAGVLDGFDGRIAPKGGMPCQHFEQDDAKGEYVRLLIR